MDFNGDAKIIVKAPGMRVIKTVVAVYVCLLLNYIRNTSLLYATIAAVLCMQNDYKDGLQVGENRVIGTLIG